MRSLAIAALLALFVAAAAVPARADGFFSPFLGFGFSGDSATCPRLTNCEEKRLQWGAAIGSTNGVLGFEEEIAYAPDFFGKTAGADNAMLTLMSNLMIVVPAGPIRPYAIVGLGLMRPHVKFDALSLALDQNALGYDLGAGINIFLTHALGLRGDLRHLRTFEDITLGVFGNDRIDFWRGSAGFTLRF
jgi:opacity protein-like surface antigen